MNIYVDDDRLKKEYDEAIKKLKAGEYSNEEEKRKLEDAVMRWLLIEQFLVYIEELNEGANPYNYKEAEYLSIEKVLK